MRDFRGLVGLTLIAVLAGSGLGVWLSRRTPAGAAGSPRPEDVVTDVPADVRVRFRHLASSLGHLQCQGCHRIAGLAGVPPGGPDLTRLRSRLSPRWLVRWLSDGAAHSTRGKSHAFHLDPEQARAVASFLWQQPDPTPPRLFPESDRRFHRREVAPRTDRFDDVACTDCHVYSGRRLVERVGCLSCHRIDGRGGRWAPELTVVGEKLRYTWLTEFLRDPERVRPGTAMPNLRLTSGQAHCIASYLAERAEVNNPHCSVGEIQEEIAGTSEPGAALGEPGERRQPAPGEAERVRKLLERKRQQASRATMFWSRLQGEADALEERFGDAKVVERGREVLVQARCAACHRIDGIPAAAPAELRRNSWTAFEAAHRAPKPGGSHPRVIPLDPAEADRLREFLGTLERFGPAAASLAGVDDAARTLVEGREVLERRGCMACHELHGARVELPVPVVRLAPQDPPTAGGCPSLGDAGRRLRPDWLVAFLDAPHAVRPGTTVHMPKFALSDAERTALLGFLREIAGTDTVAERAERVLDPSEAARAAAMFERHGCGACHLPVEEAMHGWTLKAPRVSAMADRLRRDWAVHWLADPQAAHPGTAMPKFPLTQSERDLLVDYLLSRPQDLVDREAPYQPGANVPPHR